MKPSFSDKIQNITHRAARLLLASLFFAGGALISCADSFPENDSAMLTMGAVLAGSSPTTTTTSPEDSGYSVGGYVSGLVSGTVTLQLNGSESLDLTSDGVFKFPSKLNDGATYSVVKTAEPAGYSCSVSGNSGTISGADVSGIAVLCNNTTYSVGGYIYGLSSTAETVTIANGADSLAVTNGGAYTFPTTLLAGAAYNVSITGQPATHTCSFVGVSSGTISTTSPDDVKNIDISCTTTGSTFSVGGTVTGVNGTVSLLNNGADPLNLSADGGFAFPTALADTTPYNVTIASQPTGQTCSPVNASGTIAGANVSNVGINCQTNEYLVGVTATGVSGTLILSNAGEDITITADGSKNFVNQLAHGSAYNVTVKTNPTGQTCSVVSGSGTINAADVTGIAVNCLTDVPYTVGGSLSGLSGSVTLQNNGGDDLVLGADGAFTFASSLFQGNAYAATVSAQPTGQSCSVSGGSNGTGGGTINGSNVSNLSVSCSTLSYAVGGSVSGLSGSLTLRNNGGDDLPVTVDGVFTFTTPVAYNTAYGVTLSSQPAGQTCSVSSGSGTMPASAVTGVSVTCSNNNYTVGGTVTGLSGSVTLQNNAGDDLIIGADGAFAFAGSVAHGSPYAVTVLTQPAGQTCSVSGGENGTGGGTIGSSNISSITITCANNSYTVGGNVTGLSGTVVLQNNSADDLTIGADGAFTFATSIEHNSSYGVTVQTQPAGQTCTVTSGTGSISGANESGVTVTCVNTQFSVGGSVTGLTGTVVLQNNTGDDLTIGADGGFTFATTQTSPSAYNVTVLTQPAGQTCSVSNASGTLSGAHVTDVVVSCSTNQYTAGGTIAGLSGTLVLQNNGGDNLNLVSNGAYTFSPQADGTAYNVSILTQPSGQTCSYDVVGSNTGTISGASVGNINITCSNNPYTVGVSVGGLDGTVVLQNNGGDDLSLSASGSANFATTVNFGSPYSITVLTQPSGQTCSVAGGSGTMPAFNVSGIGVSCSYNSYTVGGNLSGLTGTVELQNNLGDDLSLSADGAFTFATSLLHKSGYNVTVKTQPAGQTCSVSSGAGTINAANVAGVTVVCANNTSTYTTGGSITGLTGTVTLQNNLGDNLNVSANGSFTFATALADTSPYSVTVLTQPAGQTCSVSNASGSISGGDVTDVILVCSDNQYTAGGGITGLSGTLVLQNNGGDNLNVVSDGAYTFSPQADGTGYNVTILTQPSGQSCSFDVVGSNTGTLSGASVGNIDITCTNSTYTVGGSITGLSGSITLQNSGGDNLTTSSNGAFAFATSVAYGAAYNVTVFSDPADQTCTVSGGDNGTGGGTMGASNVSSVTISCSTDTYNVGGTISGLSGTLVLRNNGGDDYTTAANGAYTFATSVLSGSGYNVTVSSPPAGQTCSVTGGSGVVSGAHITGANVSCSDTTYKISGSVSGLVGTVTLTNTSNGDTVSPTSDGNFSFPVELVDGAPYNINVTTNPADQICSVTNGAGNVPTAEVSNVIVQCAQESFSVGGTVAGLTGTLVLRNNGGDDRLVTVDGAFTFDTPVDKGNAYNVTVASQPAGQNCIVSGGSGASITAPVNATVTCSNNSYTVGGTITGINAGTLIIQNNGGDDYTTTLNGGFNFATSLASGSGYSITVSTAPASHTCNVFNGTGTVSDGNVSTIIVDCNDTSGGGTTYTVGGTVTGLTGTLIVALNGGTTATINADGAYAFSESLLDGASYIVTRDTSPYGQDCTISNPSGSVSAANVTNVNITCGACTPDPECGASHCPTPIGVATKISSRVLQGESCYYKFTAGTLLDPDVLLASHSGDPQLYAGAANDTTFGTVVEGSTTCGPLVSGDGWDRCSTLAPGQDEILNSNNLPPMAAGTDYRILSVFGNDPAGSDFTMMVVDDCFCSADAASPSPLLSNMCKFTVPADSRCFFKHIEIPDTTPDSEYVIMMPDSTDMDINVGEMNSTVSPLTTAEASSINSPNGADPAPITNSSVDGIPVSDFISTGPMALGDFRLIGLENYATGLTFDMYLLRVAQPCSCSSNPATPVDYSGPCRFTALPNGTICYYRWTYEGNGQPSFYTYNFDLTAGKDEGLYLGVGTINNAADPWPAPDFESRIFATDLDVNNRVEDINLTGTMSVPGTDYRLIYIEALSQNPAPGASGIFYITDD